MGSKYFDKIKTSEESKAMLDMVDEYSKVCDKLAAAIIDNWDMKTLVRYATEQLSDYYFSDLNQLEEDWLLEFGKPLNITNDKERINEEVPRDDEESDLGNRD